MRQFLSVCLMTFVMTFSVISAHAAGGIPDSQEVRGAQKSSDTLVVQAEKSTEGDNSLPAAPENQTITLAAHEDPYLMGMRADIAANKAGIENLIGSIDRLERSITQQLDSLKAEIRATNARIDTTNARIDTTNERIDTTNERIDTTNARIDNLLIVLLSAAAGFIGVMLSIPIKNFLRRYKNRRPSQ